MEATKNYKFVYRFKKANCDNSIILSATSKQLAYEKFRELFKNFKNTKLKSVELYTEPIYSYY